MKITVDFLNKYDACADGILWLQKNAPDGIEILEALQNYDIPIDFILFGLRYFNISEEERAAATEKLNIINSTDIYQSYNITNSHHIRCSHDIISSSNIWSSSNIDTCTSTFNTQKASNSTNIRNSNNINFSNFVLNSQNISYSNNVYESTSISWSTAVINSLNIDDGLYASLCKDSILILIGEALKNCRNCCLCFGLDSVENYLFNEPCNPARINIIRTDLQSIILNYFNKTETKLTTFFKDLPQEAIEYIHKLPEYTPVIGSSFSQSFLDAM